MKKFYTILLGTIITITSFAQVPAHTFITGENIPRGNNWTNSNAVYDTNAIFGAPNMYLAHIASIPGVGVPQEILWGIQQTEGAYLKIFMPPGIGQINMGVNAYALAASQCMKTSIIGQYAINDPMPTSALGTAGGETWAWGCGSFNRQYMRTTSITDESYMVVGFYNEDNMYAQGFSPNDLSFTFVITDSTEYYNWYIGVVTGIIDFDKENLSIYPNPAKSILNINGYGKTISQVRIFDLTGKTVLLKQSLTQNNINVRELTEGIYFVEIKTGETIEIIKFLKQ